MIKNRRANLILALVIVIYTIGLYLFYFRYVPLVKPFQIALVPILLAILILTAIHSQWGTLLFIFAFPLINSLPYFFGIFENTPHAPTALVLFLFYFLGFLLHKLFYRSTISFKEPISKPLILFSITIFLSGIIAFLRYSNFYPFFSDRIYELTTSTYGVTAGGAIMSIVFFSLNYLTGFAFFFIFLNTVRSRDFIKKTLVILCLSTLISLSFGLFQHLKNMKLGNTPSRFVAGLINATFKDCLSFGGYIAIVAPLLLGVCLAFKGKLRVFSFLMIPLSVYLIFYTGSKSGLLCLLISLLIFSLLSLKVIFSLLKSRYYSLKKIRVSSWVVILLIFAILISVIAFKNYFVQNIKSSITVLRLKDFQAPLKYRIYNLGKLAVLMMKEYPLTGVGVGSYIIEVSNYSTLKKIYVDPESAENYILQVGSELGLVGVILVLWILWEIIKQIRSSYLKIPATDNYKFVLIGAIAGIVSFLLIIQTHTFIGSYEIKYTFWLLVGIVFCLGRPGEGKDEKYKQKPLFNKTQKIISLIVLSLFSAVHLWNSTHSLSLKNRTELLGIKQDFGFYQLEKTNEGREFRWTREYGGLTVKIEKPVIEIPLLASHPDIQQNPVKVKIYLVKIFFKQKKLLDELTLNQSIWKTCEYEVPEEVGQELILLVKVNRTWNPLKSLGTPDPRNLGVAMGKIEFKEKMDP
jgi:hypothetical protein